MSTNSLIPARSMIANPQPPDITVEAYLVAEANSPIKHEYRDGYIYAMAGASDAHVTISLNIGAIFKNYLRGSGCRAYLSDMRVNVSARNSYYYPDVMVTCDPRDRELTYYKQYPCLIIEVLSPSTEAFDRGDKFTDYQQLESLQEYILVSHTRQRIDYFQKSSQGLWILQSYYLGDILQLNSINCSIPVIDIFEDVTII
jgi:Uma2 family endonuclease